MSGYCSAEDRGPVEVDWVRDHLVATPLSCSRLGQDKRKLDLLAVVTSRTRPSL